MMMMMMKIFIDRNYVAAGNSHYDLKTWSLEVGNRETHTPRGLPNRSAQHSPFREELERFLLQA